MKNIKKNMEKDLISIIVPIYNVEDYLEECILSIIRQTYQNVEILLIDDGSTDDSSSIAKNYEKKDNRIKYYHKKNGGLSSARNYGIEKANGKYLMFIDSDDYIDYNMVEKLYDAILKNNVDISCCAMYLEYDDKTILTSNENDFYYSRVQALKELTHSLNSNTHINTSCCDKMFNAKLFKNIRFPDGRLFEDFGTYYKLVHLSNGLYHIHFPLYHYRKREGSITKSDFNIKKLDCVYIGKEIYDFLIVNYPELKKDAEYLYFEILINNTYSCYTIKEKEHYNRLRSEIRKNLIKIFCSNIIFKLKMKSIALLLNLSPIVYKLKMKKYE